VAQEVFHTCLLDASKELDMAKEITELALPPQGWDWLGGHISSPN